MECGDLSPLFMAVLDRDRFCKYAGAGNDRARRGCNAQARALTRIAGVETPDILVDWFYLLDDMKNTQRRAQDFGYEYTRFFGLLVIGSAPASATTNATGSAGGPIAFS